MIFLAADIEASWRSLLLFLCQAVYEFIAILYDLFEVIATADIITNEVLSTLYNRIGTLLGVYMLFRLILSFVQMLINPDNISDKEKGAGKIIFKVLFTFVLIAIVPFLFEKAMELQNFIVGVNGEGNVIAKVILPNQNKEAYDDFGSDLSAYLFTNFYRYDDSIPVLYRDCPIMNTDEEERKGLPSPLFTYISNNKGNINVAKDCLHLKTNGNSGDYQISFTSNGIFAVIVGGVVCYVLLTYTLMVGVRVIQLVFLRIISPMAILTFLSPKKDTMFSKWLKMCTTTYLDLFIRMAIIYFIVYIISLVIGSDTGIALVKDYDKMWVINIVMILALLIFAKKAPELLKELFPSSGVASLGFGLKSPKKMFDDMLGGSTLYKGLSSISKGATGLAIGASIGGIGNAIRGVVNDKDNRVRGFFGGLAGGAFSGGLAGARAKGVLKSFGASNKAALDQSKRIADWRADGGEHTLERWRSGLQQRFGLTTPGQVDAKAEQVLNDYIKYQDTIEGFAENNSTVKKLKRRYEQIQNAGRLKHYDPTTGLVIGEETDAEFNARIENARTDYKDAVKAVVTAGMSGSRTTSYIDSSGSSVSIAVEAGIGDSIRVTTDKLNRDIDNNDLSSRGYTHVTTYDEMDTQTNRARADVTTLTSTSEFASHKADDKYSGSGKS